MMQPIMAVVYREFLLRRTSVLWLFFDVVVPLLYLLMFGVGFNKALGQGIAVSGSIIHYNEFFFAGVLAMACFGNAINQSYGFFIDRDNGIFYEFLTYPMTRGQFLFGKILFQCLLACVQCVLAIAAGVFLLGIVLRGAFLPLVLAVVMIGTAGWFFCLSTVAFLVRRNDTFNTVINLAYFVLMFVSSLFYPLEGVPAWLRTVSYGNPLTWLTDVLRFLTIGMGEASMILIELACFLVFLLVSFRITLKVLENSI